MKKLILFLAMLSMAIALVPSVSLAEPVDTVVFMQYFGHNGPALGGYYTGEYNFHIYSAIQASNGTLSSDALLGDISLWCLNPFATIGGSAKYAFAVGSGDSIGQLHDLNGEAGNQWESEADSFYRETTAMYLEYYRRGDTGLRDDLQASIWERRDMMEGPSGTHDTDSFNFLTGDYDLGSAIPSQILSGYTYFNNLPSGGIGTIFSPIGVNPVFARAGDIQYNDYQYDYNHNMQEFGYTVPEPSSLLLIGSGMILAAAFLRRRK